MYIRKKNNENARIKRPPKRCKSYDMFFNTGFGLYLKPMAIFSALLTLDFLMEVRVEYLWSCWFLFKSASESYKYQGLVFSLFFVLLVLTSDIICYLLIPVTWLFFIASSYVWVQLVGQTERGICMPTIGICLFFFYIEYVLRLRSFSHLAFGVEICKPFAAHGIGYPFVTMGFGLKTYITYRFRMRKQRDVEAVNRFHFQLLDQALPDSNRRYRVHNDAENESSSIGDDSIENSSIEAGPTKSSTKTSIIPNGKIEQSHSSDLLISKCPPNNIDYINQWAMSTNHKNSSTTVSSSGCNMNNLLTNHNQHGPINGHVKHKPPSVIGNGNCIVSSQNSNSTITAPADSLNNNGASIAASTTGACTETLIRSKKQSTTANSSDKSHNKSSNCKKEEISKTESDLKKLRNEVQIARNAELDLKTQLSQMNQSYHSAKMELSQLRQELSATQNKLQTIQQKLNTEKQNSQNMEKKLSDEKKTCQLLEQQLVFEKKARKEESEIKSKALQSATLAAAKPSECTESCKYKRRQMETELKALRKEKQSREDQLKTLEQQLSEIPKLRKMAEDYQLLSMNITNLREEKEHLVRTLSDENKIKQNLITAYHSSLKEVNALNEQLTQKDYQILQLNVSAGVSANSQDFLNGPPTSAGSSGNHNNSNNSNNSNQQQQQHHQVPSYFHTTSPILSSSPSLMDHQQQSQQHHHMSTVAASNSANIFFNSNSSLSSNNNNIIVSSSNNNNNNNNNHNNITQHRATGSPTSLFSSSSGHLSTMQPPPLMSNSSLACGVDKNTNW